MKIQIVKGKFDETCTMESNLIENQAHFPAISDIIQYAEQRMLSTLIVSGAKTAESIGKVPTKIGTVPSSKLVGSSGYRYAVMGRIQQASVIDSQVGSSGTDGTFSLVLKDNYLYPGMVAIFHTGLQAREMGEPTGAPGAYTYNFQTVDGTVFVWATHVAPQNGEKTCFGSTTGYEEKSLRGFSRSHYSDVFINHMTIQRKTLALSGDALSDVLWYQYKGTKGWLFAKERQSRLQFMMEDEFQKWFGRSTMKNADGTLRAQSRLIDPSSGNSIVMGDGLEAQIEGGNVAFGSGTDGSATLADIEDMMTTLEKNSDVIEGKVWYCVTGTDGYNNAQRLLETKATGTFQLVVNKEGSLKPGGPDVSVGYNFNTYNINGNQVIFVKHPLFDDKERFTQRVSAGKLLHSSALYFLDLAASIDGTPNMEILNKGAYGANRTMVSAYLNGLTGLKKGNVVSSVDGLEFHMLKQDGIFIYNTRTCGIIYKTT